MITSTAKRITVVTGRINSINKLLVTMLSSVEDRGAGNSSGWVENCECGQVDPCFFLDHQLVGLLRWAPGYED